MRRAASRRRRRRQREKAPRRVATRPAHGRLALGAEALRVRARRDERLRRQRQDECGNAHRCNLPFTPAAPSAARGCASALLSCPSAAAPSRSRWTPGASVRVVAEESVATRETDGSGGWGLGDARVCAAARAVSIMSRRLRATAAGDAGKYYGRIEVPKCLGGRGLGVARGGGRGLARRAFRARVREGCRSGRRRIVVGGARVPRVARRRRRLAGAEGGSRVFQF